MRPITDGIAGIQPAPNAPPQCAKRLLAVQQLKAVVGRSSQPCYNVDAAARPYLTHLRIDAICCMIAHVTKQFALPDRMAWVAARLLFRYIGRLERRGPDEPAGALHGGADRSASAEVLEHPCPTQPYALDRQVQVAALACVDLAAKLGEVKHPDCTQLCEEVAPAPTVAELAGMQTSIVIALEWGLASPTPHQMVECFLHAHGFEVPCETVPFEKLPHEWKHVYWACDATAYCREFVFEPVRLHAAASLEALRRYSRAAHAAFTARTIGSYFAVPTAAMHDGADVIRAVYDEHHALDEERSAKSSN
jgi:hypothetical protein